MPSQTEKTEQYVDNLSFDEEFGVLAAEWVGHDDANGVLRRVQVDENGKLKIV